MQALIADDEFFIRYMIRNLIDWREEHFEIVHESENGLGALEIIRQHKPEVAVLDVRMPGMTGLEVAAESVALSPNTMIVIASGYADFTYAQTALRNPNIVDYLLKPLQEDALRNAVRNCVGRRNKRKDDLEKERALSAQDLLLQKTLEDDWMFFVLDDIQMNITKDISLGALAQKYHVSEGHLSKQLKQKLGMTYSDYVYQQRMKLAAHLLAATDASVSKIAYDVGYKDTIYFAKQFKMMFGQSPSEYRKKQRKS